MRPFGFLFIPSLCLMSVRRSSLLLLLIVVVGLMACAADEPSSDGPASASDTEATTSTAEAQAPTARRSIPSFEATTLGGDTMTNADWEGQVVVLNFWATWCAPCRIEIPRLIDLYNEMPASDVRVVGISIDEEGADVVVPYAEEMEIPYPLILDPDQSLAEAFGGHYAVPTTFIIDQEGTVRQRFMRVVAHDELVAAIEPLLKEG